jgi:hypothetical protein
MLSLPTAGFCRHPVVPGCHATAVHCFLPTRRTLAGMTRCLGHVTHSHGCQPARASKDDHIINKERARPTGLFACRNKPKRVVAPVGSHFYTESHLEPGVMLLDGVYPMRPGEKRCGFFVKNGYCMFKAKCRSVPEQLRQGKPLAATELVAQWCLHSVCRIAAGANAGSNLQP